MPEPEIKICLHDDHVMMIRRWHSEGKGLLLIIDDKETVAGNDDNSRRYLMERVLKAVRESAYRLVCPEEEPEEE